MKKSTKKGKKAVKPVKKAAKKKSAPRSAETGNDIRALTKVSGGASYAITLPRSVVKAFKWKERQKLKLDIDEKRGTITIRNLKK